jgi:predicted RNase H-like nuclease
MRSYTTIIGIDCACQAKDVGLARAQWHAGHTTVTEVLCGKDVRSIPALVEEWMDGADRCLLALDAPLGWPQAMGHELDRHQAGNAIPVAPNTMFRRTTDIDIKSRFGKTPLDVGADRIARTAHWALSLLAEIRRMTGMPISLAWSPQGIRSPEAIEVYPAGALIAHRMPASGYKKAAQRDVRGDMLTSLIRKLSLPDNHDSLLNDADCLDAAYMHPCSR